MSMGEGDREAFAPDAGDIGGAGDMDIEDGDMAGAGDMAYAGDIAEAGDPAGPGEVAGANAAGTCGL